jgi:tetratricopeptide (TPR) repeat protein
MVGTTVSHYTILEHLGVGGMGIVYKAHDTKLDRPVALKFLPPSLTANPEAKQRFVHEAKAASALDHPNICNIHDIGETDDGQIFIVMAYYEGDTVKEKIERGPLEIDEAIDIAKQVAQGLARAHEDGIIHRDIKPANIMVTPHGVAKIVDFGLAKLRGSTMLTKTGRVMGTAAYMSPEQARGDAADARTDIWSLGVVFYEMLTARKPFESDYDQALIYSILNKDPKGIRDLRPDVSDSLDRITRRAMAKEPDDRYQSAGELLADLETLGTVSGLAGKTKRERPHPASLAGSIKLTVRKIRSRKLIPALIAYAGFSLGILLLAQAVFNRLEWPPALSSALLALLVCGAPAALIAAWYRGRSEREKVRRRKYLLYGANAVIALAAACWVWVSAGAPRKAEVFEKSIAILYIKNLGPEADEPYSYGITQDLIIDVAKAGLVHVAPMKDVLSIRNQDIPLGKLSEQLRVRYVLDGSLRRDGDSFRLTAQIVEAATGLTKWADRIQVKASEAMSLQSTLARAIITALQLKPSEAVSREIATGKTANAEAYEFYLRANYLFNTKKTKEDVLVARGMYEKAFTIDSALIDAWLGAGRTHELEGDLDAALPFYERAQGIARAMNDRLGEAKSLIRLGSYRLGRSEFGAAREFYSRSLDIARECGDKDGETRSLIAIGDVAYGEGDYGKAHEYYGQAKLIARTLGDRPLEANLLFNEGSVFYYQLDHARALECYTESYRIRSELGDLRAVSTSLTGMALARGERREYDSALANYQQALGIARELGVRAGEANILSNMALAYDGKHDYPNAITSYLESIAIAESLHDRRLECHAHVSLGDLYSRLGQFAKASEHLDRGLGVSREIGARREEAFALDDIGQMYYRQCEFAAATEKLGEAGKIKHELGDDVGEAITLTTIGLAKSDQGAYEEALDHHSRALRIMEQSTYREGQAFTLLSLGVAHQSLGHREKALECFNRSLSVAETLQHDQYRGEALAEIGMWYLTEGKYSEAIDSLRKAAVAIQEAPEAETSLLVSARLGLALARAGNREEAASHAEQAADSLPAIGLSPRSVEILWYLYQTYLSLGDAPKADRSVDTAYAAIRMISSKIADPAMRQSYLTRVKENREILAAWKEKERGRNKPNNSTGRTHQ